MIKSKTKATGSIEVSQTSFADFVLKMGLPKLTCAQSIRRQYERGYSPALDYYKKFRNTVRSTHRQHLPMISLGDALKSVANANKQANYELLGRGYTKFWSSYLEPQSLQWCTAPVAAWTHGRVTVRVNPELAFRDERHNYLVKLYVKDEPLTKPQVSVILHLMQLALRPVVLNPVCVILDVRRGKPFEATTFNPKWTVLLEGEALSFERMYTARFDDETVFE